MMSSRSIEDWSWRRSGLWSLPEYFITATQTDLPEEEPLLFLFVLDTVF